MTYESVYISSAENKDTLGKRISPLFPSGRYKMNVIDDWALNLGKHKINIDWGSYCYPVNKKEILDCVALLYRNDPNYNDPQEMLEWKGEKYMVNQLDELVKSLSELDDDGSYAIVWSEL